MRRDDLIRMRHMLDAARNAITFAANFPAKFREIQRTRSSMGLTLGK